MHELHYTAYPFSIVQTLDAAHLVSWCATLQDSTALLYIVQSYGTVHTVTAVQLLGKNTAATATQRSRLPVHSQCAKGTGFRETCKAP